MKRNYRSLMPIQDRWRERWSKDGFYRDHTPYQHFDTFIQHSEHLGNVLSTWLTDVNGGRVEIVDLGAGDGGLASSLSTLLPTAIVHAVDVRQRPAHLSSDVAWHTLDVTRERLPHLDAKATPVLIAHEFLDDVPCDVVEVDNSGTCIWMHADGNGFLTPGDVVEDQGTRDWIHRWWPPLRPGMRIEVGLARDQLWHRLLRTWPNTIGIAIDYGHTLRERMIGTWDGGTVTGYRNGHQVVPQLDGHTNVTAHVAVDAIAAVAPRSEITRLRAHLNWRDDLQSTGSLGDFHVVVSHMTK
jgi:SAM-dependent MidA family methyltransferase